jgi:hypothetical protein
LVVPVIATRCPECGGPVGLPARSCALCGAPNRARAVVLAVAALLSSLVVGIGIAAVVIPRSAAPPNDFAWLTKAMQDCDTEAAKQQSTLYFLIIPIASKPEDDAQWRSQSLNEIGNAILLSSDVALDGLKRQALKISTEEYAFNVRDRDNTIYNWQSSIGPARLTIPNANAIEGFNIQFRTRSRTSETAWGNAFVRRGGTCYWVNAIIGN